MSTGGFNQLILIGKLGADPSLQYAERGKARCNIVLVCADRFINEEQIAVEQTHTFEIEFREEEAERLHRLCRKGNQILVEGRLSGWKDKAGRSQLKIWGNRFSLLNKQQEEKTNLWPEASQPVGKFHSMGMLTDTEEKE